MAIIRGRGTYAAGEGLVGACLECDSGFTTAEEYEAHDCEHDAAVEIRPVANRGRATVAVIIDGVGEVKDTLRWTLSDGSSRTMSYECQRAFRFGLSEGRHEMVADLRDFARWLRERWLISEAEELEHYLEHRAWPGPGPGEGGET